MENIGDDLDTLFAQRRSHVYALYCAEQKQSAELYNNLQKSDTHFATAIRKIEARLECARLKFTDFNAKVMQRLTKYPLLVS